jgi:hypothetical protein
MKEIKDAPWIQRAERYGDPWCSDYGRDDEDYEEDYDEHYDEDYDENDFKEVDDLKN